MKPYQFQLLLLLKLPIAWIAGLRLEKYEISRCDISVRYGFLNQNPFQSMFWAVQGMAAELSSGLLAMHEIRSTGRSISMLVIEQHASFSKKAKGKIIFSCQQGDRIKNAIELAIDTNNAQTITVESFGHDESGDLVSSFHFVWSFKLKS